MVKVVFAGDEPSELNVSPDIAFVGAKCFTKVVEWIKELEPDFYVCLNTDTVSQLSDINKLYKSGFKIIALGEKASKRLEKMEIAHAVLPHPSPLNRKLNNKKKKNKKEVQGLPHLMMSLIVK